MSKTMYLLVLIIVSSVYSSSWQRISGSYSFVEYQAGNEKIADSLLAISESSLIRLMHLLRISRDEFKNEPVRIIYVDALDISNGFALENTIVIYALSSAYIPTWTGTQKWYEQVLNHELVHVVTFRKIRRTANIFGTVAYLTTPRWFYEGVAQYYAEDWNAYRGDIFLKNALFEGNLNLGSLVNLENGQLVYAAGNAFVRYLANQYGDSSIVKLMEYDSSSFIYNFPRGFKKVYGASLQQVFKKFIQHMIIYYGSEYSVYDELIDLARIPTYGSHMYQVIPFSSSDSTYLISAQVGLFDQYRTALITQIKNGKMVVKQELFDNYHTSLAVSSDKNRIAFGRIHFSSEDNINGLSFDWFIYDRTQKTIRRVVTAKHIRFAAFLNENTLVFGEVLGNGTVFLSYNLTSDRLQSITRTSMPVGRMVSLKNDRIIFEAQRGNGFRDLFYLSADSLTGILNDAADDRLPVIIDENHFVFTRLINRKPAVCLFNIQENSFRILFEDLNDYWTHAYIHEENKLVLKRWESDNRALYSIISIDSLSRAKYTPKIFKTPQRYRSWTSQRPVPDLITREDTMITSGKKEGIASPYFPLEHGLSLGLPVYDEKYGFGIYGISSWFEILQRHALAATFIIFPGQMNRSLIFLSHFFKIMNLDVTSVYYHGPVLFSNRGNTYLDIIRDVGALNVSRNIALNGNPRWSLQPAFAFIWNRYNHQEKGTVQSDDKNYAAMRVGGRMEYAHPTRLYPLLPQRQIGLYGYVHQSIDKNEDFRIWEAGFFGGTRILLESLGIRSHFSYLHQAGNQSRAVRVGIDRFFETNLPRDYGYTRAVRGVREDIYGDKLLWTSTDIIIYVARTSGLKLLFIPLHNLALSGFFDFAEISSSAWTASVSGFGGELTSGSTYFRFGLGFAHGRESNGSKDNYIYWRLALSFPQPALGIPDQRHSL